MYLKGIYGSIRYSIIVGTFFLVFKAQDKDIYTNGKILFGVILHKVVSVCYCRHTEGLLRVLKGYCQSCISPKETRGLHTQFDCQNSSRMDWTSCIQISDPIWIYIFLPFPSPFLKGPKGQEL